MWLMTKYGFFSVVECAYGVKMVIRARDRNHLQELKNHTKIRLPRIETNAGTDYPYRITVERSVAERLVLGMVEGIDYTNFKNKAAENEKHHPKYMDFLHAVWGLGLKLERTKSAKQTHPWRRNWPNKVK